MTVPMKPVNAEVLTPVEVMRGLRNIYINSGRYGYELALPMAYKYKTDAVLDALNVLQDAYDNCDPDDLPAAMEEAISLLNNRA